MNLLTPFYSCRLSSGNFVKVSDSFLNRQYWYYIPYRLVKKEPTKK